MHEIFVSIVFIICILSLSINLYMAWHIRKHYISEAKASGKIIVKNGKVSRSDISSEAKKNMQKAYEVEKELLKLIERSEKDLKMDLSERELVSYELVQLSLLRLDYLQQAVESGFNPELSHKGQKMKLSEMIKHDTDECNSILLMLMRPGLPKKKPKPTLRLIKD